MSTPVPRTLILRHTHQLMGTARHRDELHSRPVSSPFQDSPVRVARLVQGSRGHEIAPGTRSMDEYGGKRKQSSNSESNPSEFRTRGHYCCGWHAELWPSSILHRLFERRAPPPAHVDAQAKRVSGTCTQTPCVKKTTNPVNDPGYGLQTPRQRHLSHSCSEYGQTNPFSSHSSTDGLRDSWSSAVHLLRSPLRERRLPVLEVDHMERGAAAISANRKIHLSFVRRENAVHHSDVAFSHIALSELMDARRGTQGR